VDHDGAAEMAGCRGGCEEAAEEEEEEEAKECAFALEKNGGEVSIAEDATRGLEAAAAAAAAAARATRMEEAMTDMSRGVESGSLLVRHHRLFCTGVVVRL
jgi:hypothetical protein